jgi:hypothetical protein
MGRRRTAQARLSHRLTSPCWPPGRQVCNLMAVHDLNHAASRNSPSLATAGHGGPPAVGLRNSAWAIPGAGLEHPDQKPRASSSDSNWVNNNADASPSLRRHVDVANSKVGRDHPHLVHHLPRRAFYSRLLTLRCTGTGRSIRASECPSATSSESARRGSIVRLVASASVSSDGRAQKLLLADAVSGTRRG